MSSRFRRGWDTDKLSKQTSVRKQVGLDASLDKLTYTLDDFTSHLSNVDSTLARMEGGFRNVSQFCQQLSHSANPLVSDSEDEDLPEQQTTLSDSSSAGRSFECANGDVNSHRVDRPSSPSSLIETVSDPSSVWSTSTTSGEREQWARRYLQDQRKHRELNGLTGKSSVSNRTLYDHTTPYQKHTADFSPSQSDCSSYSQPSLRSHSSKCSPDDGEYVNHKVSSRRSEIRHRKFSSPGDSYAVHQEEVCQVPSPSTSVPIAPHICYENVDRKQETNGRRRYRRPSDQHSGYSDHQSPLSVHQQKLMHASGSFNQLLDCNTESEQIISVLENYLRHGEESKARRLLSDLLGDPRRRGLVKTILTSLSQQSQMRKFENSTNNRDSLLQLATSAMQLNNHSYSGIVGADQSQPLARSRGSSCTLFNPHTSHYSLAAAFPSGHSSPHGSGSLSYMPDGQSTLGRASTFVRWLPDSFAEDSRLPVIRQHRPAAPHQSKSVILPISDVMQRLDSDALRFTDLGSLASFVQLVSQITATLSDDIRILRSLFIWTVALNVDFYQFDPTAPPDTLIGLLRRIRGGQLTRNELLRRLCRYASIDCRLITGYSKQSADYRPKSSCGLLHTSWLAVYVADGWRFVNADLASRSQTRVDQSSFSIMQAADEPSVKFSCDEFYFLTDPEQHIFEYFPDHKAWQLLRKSVSFDFFLSLPLLKSAFFNADLALKVKYSACLLTSNGQVTVKLLMPRFVGISCSLENASDHSVLRGLCLVEVMPSGDLVRVEAAPSHPGKYYLHIFVSPDWRLEDYRELACSFQINCSEHNYSRLVVTGRLPEVGFLGPTPLARTLGIGMLPEGVARHGRPFLTHPSGHTLRIPFAVASGLKVCHQLKSFDRPGHQMVDCDSYAFLQMRSNKGLAARLTGNSGPAGGGSGCNAFYHLRMPADGFYYLTVYATQLSDSDHLECVYRLLVNARKAVQLRQLPAPFPRQTLWWVHCYLVEPLSQRLPVGREHRFEVEAPLCDAIAVVVNGADWHFLNPDSSNRRWFGRIHLGNVLGNLSVFGRFPNPTQCLAPLQGRSDSAPCSADDDEAFVKLLDYLLVEPVLTS